MPRLNSKYSKYGTPFIAKVYRTSLDNVLHRIMEQNPGAAEEDTWPIFRAEVLKDDAMTEACVRHYHMNARGRLSVPRVAPPKKRAVIKKERLARAAYRAERVNAKLILDHIMPNNKPLRECTFGYATEVGGAFARIGAMGHHPDAIIGQHLSDTVAELTVGDIGPEQVEQQPNGNGKATHPHNRIGAAILRAMNWIQ